MVLNDDTLEPQTIVFHEPTGSSRKPKDNRYPQLVKFKETGMFLRLLLRHLRSTAGQWS